MEGHGENARASGRPAGVEAPTDAALATRIARGDASAEGELCARLWRRVFAWALRRTRDAHGASDVAQHAVVVVLEALREGRVADVERLASFALAVADRTLAAWRRGERRRAELLERFGAAFADSARIDDAALDRRRVEPCFAELTSRAQAVLALTFYADRSADEIADELAVSSANVRVLRHRALRQLHDCVTRKP